MNMATCTICSRPLTDPVSIERGMGPVCAARNNADAEQVSIAGVTVLVNGAPLRHIVRHSPTGMEWGYGGSGPSDLARSILADFAGIKVADMFYQEFKWDFIAKQPEKGFQISGQEILDWLKRKIET